MQQIITPSVLDFRAPAATDAPRIELEEAVLGTIMFDPDILSQIADLPPAAFSISAHRRIFQAALEVYKSGRKPDALTLEYTMAETGELQEIGGRAKIAQLLNRQAVYSGMAVQYAQILKQDFHRHQISHNLKRIAELVEGGNMDEELIQQLEEQIQATRSGQQSSPDSRLRFDLLMLLNETDPIKKARLKAEISSRYRLTKMTIDELLHHLKEQVNTPQKPSFTLGEFLTQSETALEYLVPGMLPKGESILLAAQPKCGKTLLTIDLAYAVATGAEFLGEAVPQGKVLLISVDESAQSLRHKLEQRGFDPEEHGDRVQVITRWNLSQLEALEEILESFRPDLVIVDSLRRVAHGSTISENSAEFADNLYTLKETLTRYGAAGILVHHTNKDKEAQGVYQVRGSSAISGAVWGTWQLRHILKPDPHNKKKQTVDPKETKRILEIHSRDTQGQTLTIDFDPEDRHWIHLGAVDESSETQTLRQRIRDLLEVNRHREGLSAREIKELLELEPDDRYIYSALDRMVERREIQRKQSETNRKIKIYCLPVQSGDTPPPGGAGGGDEYRTETQTKQDFQEFSRNSSPPENSSSPPNTENTVMNSSNPDVISESGVIHHPSSPSQGESTPAPNAEYKETQSSLKVGDRVRIDCFGSKKHGKAGVIKRIKFEGKVQLADVQVEGGGFRYWETPLSSLERLD